MNPLYLKCPKCGYKATTTDYLCPKCQVKFRPRPVVVISAVMMLFGIFGLAPLMIILAIGIFLMKQWARRWLLAIIFMQIFLFIVFAGLFDLQLNLAPENLVRLAILLFILLPLAIYLSNNKEVNEAFFFYGGHN